MFVCAYVWVCVCACAQECAWWQQDCVFPTCGGTVSYGMEEGKVLIFSFTVFFTLCKGNSGFVTPSIFLKGPLFHLHCLTVLLFPLMTSHRLYSRESPLRHVRLDNSGVRQMLLLLIHSWVVPIHLSYNNSSPLLQPKHLSKLTGRWGTFTVSECCHFN